LERITRGHGGTTVCFNCKLLLFVCVDFSPVLAYVLQYVRGFTVVTTSVNNCFFSNHLSKLDLSVVSDRRCTALEPTVGYFQLEYFSHRTVEPEVNEMGCDFEESVC
jgi:hypothetical protein